ncbi:MAG: alpha/beta hydrolase [Anaerolineae bacterium]|nr:alpha/beta hydrolase [Anaerolineae bacterium]
MTGIEHLHRFCTPKQRDTNPKITASLAEAVRRDLPFSQTLNYPPQPRTEQFNLATFTWGDAAQPAIVIAHGWELQAGYMTHFVAPLRAAGFRVVAFDAPANGQSGGHELNLPDYVRAYACVCADAGHVVGLLGHSFGGLAALWLCATQPLASVRRVVSVASAAGANLLTRNYIRLNGLSEAEGQDFIDAFKLCFGAAPDDYTMERYGPRIRVPTLIVHDRRDTMVGFDESDRILTHVPNATRLETNGLGHRSILRVPEVIAAATAFFV